MKYFHGDGKKRSYFEGWYLKHQAGGHVLALIPAFHIDRQGKKSASLQVVTGRKSFMIPFQAEQFHADVSRFHVTLGKCVFTGHGISLDVSTDELYMKGELRYGDWARPYSDIMGPFAHIPFMECSHEVLSLTHTLSGTVNINGWVVDFTGGTGYIEKDRGSSFPSSYLWTQCNWTQKISRSPCCMMLALADIPFLGFHFTGCICSVFYGGEEYRLATYRGARILEYTKREVIVGQGDYLVHINLLEDGPQSLAAPVSGAMSRTIRESPCCQVRYQFFIRSKKICDVVSRQAGFETGGELPENGKRRRFRQSCRGRRNSSSTLRSRK